MNSCSLRKCGNPGIHTGASPLPVPRATKLEGSSERNEDGKERDAGPCPAFLRLAWEKPRVVPLNPIHHQPAAATLSGIQAPCPVFIRLAWIPRVVPDCAAAASRCPRPGHFRSHHKLRLRSPSSHLALGRGTAPFWRVVAHVPGVHTCPGLANGLCEEPWPPIQTRCPCCIFLTQHGELTDGPDVSP